MFKFLVVFFMVENDYNLHKIMFLFLVPQNSKRSTCVEFQSPLTNVDEGLNRKGCASVGKHSPPAVYFEPS